jgi:TfoX/Sxy family transcriptional regulator of competence genes
MAWVKIPPENQPIFLAALPKDPRVQTMKMFGGIAATINGNMFAGLFGLSTIIWLPEDERETALALKGASMFDPMGDGRKSDKVMLPVSMMKKPADLKKWIAKSFKAAAELPPKKKKPAKKKK